MTDYTTLHHKLITLRQTENESIASIVEHLAMLDAGGGYRDLGYSSLFSYCTEGLGYSESSAFRRVRAARLVGEHPDILGKIRSGALHLCAVAELSKVVTEENKELVVPQAEHASRREVQKIVAELLPPVEVKSRERIVPRRVKAPTVSNDETMFPLLPPVEVARSYGVSFEGDEEFMKLLTEAKGLLGGHGTAEVLKRALRMAVRARSPKERMKRRVKRRMRVEGKRTRHIPAQIRDRVLVRDGGRCTFCGPDGKRCSETSNLEIDHVTPFALGGEHTEANLRVMCGAHNRLLGERVFGRRG